MLIFPPLPMLWALLNVPAAALFLLGLASTLLLGLEVALQVLWLVLVVYVVVSGLFHWALRRHDPRWVRLRRVRRLSAAMVEAYEAELRADGDALLVRRAEARQRIIAHELAEAESSLARQLRRPRRAAPQLRLVSGGGR